MQKIRQLLWNMGMVPSRTTSIVVGMSLTGCVAIIVFGILLALTHDSLFTGLILLAAVPASLLMFASSTFTESWMSSTRKERARLEKERALELLRLWLHSNSSKKDKRQP
jgi:hypothetical protein